MEERRDRRQYDAQLSVMDKKHDQTDDTLCEMGCQINRVEGKVKHIEKSLYVFMGLLIFINVLWFIPLIVGE